MAANQIAWVRHTPSFRPFIKNLSSNAQNTVHRYFGSHQANLGGTPWVGAGFQKLTRVGGCYVCRADQSCGQCAWWVKTENLCPQRQSTNGLLLERYQACLCKTHGGESTRPRTETGQKRCTESKTIHGRETLETQTKKHPSLSKTCST